MPATSYTVASAAQLGDLTIHFDTDSSDDETDHNDTPKEPASEKLLPQAHSERAHLRTKPGPGISVQTEAHQTSSLEIFFSPIESTTSSVRLSDPVLVSSNNPELERLVAQVSDLDVEENKSNTKNSEQDAHELRSIQNIDSEQRSDPARAKVIQATQELELLANSAVRTGESMFCSMSDYPAFEAKTLDETSGGMSASSASSAMPNSSFTISTSQLDQLINALASAPLITSNVHHHGRRNFKRLHETPRESSSTSSSTLYSLDNKQFISTKAQASAPFILPICGPVEGTAVIDAIDRSSTIHYASFEVVEECSGSILGADSHLTMPTDRKCSSTLHIHNIDVESGRSKIMLHTITAMQTRATKERICHISTEQDVTKHFQKAALAELTRLIDKPVEVVDRFEPISQSTSRAESLLQLDDFLLMAEELQDLCETADVVDSVANQFRSLDEENCSMQTLTLLSQLSKLKTDHRYVLLARFPDHSASGRGLKADLQVPLVSEALASLLVKCYGQADQDLNDLVEPLTSSVCDLICHQLHKRHFELFEHGALGFLLKGVPVYSGRTIWPRAWIIYVERDAALDLTEYPLT